jgi:hypothetical protein
MNLYYWILMILAAGGLGSLAWWSVQSLAQARLLSRCRRASLAGLVGQGAALRGRVLVHRVLRVAHLGDLLWHREIVKTSRGKHESTESDYAEMAHFSIVVGGEPVRVSGEPTEVQSPATKSVTDEFDVSMLVTGRETVIDEWVPVVDELTVVGQVVRTDRGWEIVSDARVGLLLTMRDPGPAATHESIKGWLGLAGVVAGGAILLWFTV